MTDLQANQLFDLMYRRKETKFIYNVYHYTTADITNLILREEGICLQMTRMDNFEDKLEGKTVDSFYQKALKKLLKENKLSKSQYELLVKIKAPQKNVTAFDEGKGVYRGELAESDVYIICFSKEKDNPYMIENYIKNDNHSGYCLDFVCCNLESNEITNHCFGTGLSFNMLIVKYEKQVILEMCEFIEELLKIFHGCDDEFEKHSSGIIKTKLNELKYATKLEDFQPEKEIRLILIVPKGQTPHETMKMYFEPSKNGCIIKLPRYVLHGINKSPNLTDDEDKKWREIFKQRGYEFLH